MTAAPSPIVVSNTLTYTIAVTNAGPSPATGVIISNILPPGVINVTASSIPAGTLTTNAGIVTCTFGTLATNGVGTLTITAVPTTADLGFITNTVSVSSAQVEDNPVDNTSSVVTAVNTPTADLGIAVSDSPDPVLVSNNITYSIVVSNLGPALATSVVVSNTPPAGVTILSTSASGGTTTNSGFVTFNLGNVAVGATTNFTVIVRPNIAGTLTNDFAVISPVPEVTKANNFASVKTVVQSLQSIQLSVSRTGSSLQFSWPTTGSVTLNLQFATTLNPPNWQNVSGNPPLISGGVETVTIPIGSGTQFFRLSGH